MTTVTVTDIKRVVTLNSLKPGDCFLVETMLDLDPYIMVSCLSQYNCVNLRTGAPNHFDKATVIIYLNKMELEVCLND